MSRAISELEIERAAARVAALLGLHFPPPRRRELKQGLLKAAEELGKPASLEWLFETDISRREADVLASHLTIGETYFFRERPVFGALERKILPELIQERYRTNRTLRIWSAGCCTGEEPYSVAMLLERLIPDIDDWKISLLATDLNPRFLQRAAHGVYKDWSFRDVAPGIQERFFVPLSPGKYELTPRVKRRVRFAQLNLAEESFPSPINGTWELDLILCRNVLMYFAAETMARVVARLRSCLAPGGWLVVSPTETSQQVFTGFAHVQFDDAILYRRAESGPAGRTESGPAGRAESGPAGRAESGPAPTLRPSPTLSQTPQRFSASPAPRSSALPVPAPVERSEVAQLARARAAANAGRLEEAVEECARVLVTQKLDPAIYHLYATILDELNRPAEAADALRRALYLDPEFVLAHFALGHLARKQRKADRARRHFETVLGLLATAPDEMELPHSGGITAGRLAELTRSLIARLT